MINTSPILNVSKAYTDKDPNRSIYNVMLQLGSETGEMQDWINRPWRQKEEFAGECADVINCVVDALWLYFRSKHPGLSDDEISKLVVYKLNQQIEVKTKKWADAVL